MNKFKKGDKVRVIGLEATIEALGEPDVMIGDVLIVTDTEYDDGSISADFPGPKEEPWWFVPADLELVEEPITEFVQDGKRTFDGGATRDTAKGKLDYVKGLSPIVLRRYMQYLDKHRLQPDGTYREFDNWKQGIPHDVYLSSLSRHCVDVWLLSHGFTTSDNHGPVELQDAICAVIFNAMGMLHEQLMSHEIGLSGSKPGYGGKPNRTQPVEGGY